MLPTFGAWLKVTRKGVSMQRSVAPLFGATVVMDIADTTSNFAGLLVMLPLELLITTV